MCSQSGNIPGDFKYPINDPSGVWGNPGGNSGACQGDPTGWPSNLRGIYAFDGLGGVSANMGNVPDANVKGCMSFGAEACAMKKEDIEAIQFRASSSGCYDPQGKKSVWACPLWLNSNQWQKPQGESGEIDFLERCGDASKPSPSGFYLNFGNAGDADCTEAGGKGTCTKGQTNFPVPNNIDFSQTNTYYLKFNNTGDETNSVEAWVCPQASNPMQEGTAGCTFWGKNVGYFTRTKKTGEADQMHFVTDIWNVPGAQAGTCTPTAGSYTNKDCKYEVYDIKVKQKTPFTNQCSVFNP